MIVQTERFAVRHPKKGWLRHSKGFDYGLGKHSVWTKDFAAARLLPRISDAVHTARLYKANTYTVQCVTEVEP